MTPLIRDANESDIPAIIDVRTSVRENHLSVAQMAAMGITQDSIRAALRAEPCIWIAEWAGKIVGFSMADRADACVFATFVHPDYEGRSIGRKLMERAETFLFERHTCIWLETDSASRAAGFYENLGWTRGEALSNGDVRFEKRLKTSAG